MQGIYQKHDQYYYSCTQSVGHEQTVCREFTTTADSGFDITDCAIVNEKINGPEGDLPQAIMLMATKQKHKSFVLGIYVTSMV